MRRKAGPWIGLCACMGQAGKPMPSAAAAGIMLGRVVETPARRSTSPRAGFLSGMERAVGRPASRVGQAGSVSSLKGRDGLAQLSMEEDCRQSG